MNLLLGFWVCWRSNLQLTTSRAPALAVEEWRTAPANCLANKTRFLHIIYIYICQLKYPQKETETKKIEAIHSFYIYSGNQWYRNTILKKSWVTHIWNAES